MEPAKIEPFDLEVLGEEWGNSIVPRNKVGDFDKGLNPRTMANHDSLGTGPEGRFKIGRLVYYPTKSLIRWMKARQEACK